MPTNESEEQEIVSFREEDLVVLTRCPEWRAYSYRVTPLEKFKADGFSIDLDKGTFLAEGIEDESYVGQSCYGRQENGRGVLGVFDRTRDDHLNAMLAATAGTGNTFLNSACRAIG